MSRHRVALLLVLAPALAACADSGRVDPGRVAGFDEDSVSDSCATCLSGTTVMKHVADHLANDPTATTVRVAFDRAINDVGHFGVAPQPDEDCSGKIVTGYWNGEEQALARLGGTAVADLLALEAVSQGPLETSLLSTAPLASGDTSRIFRILAKTESPALVYEASWSLLANPGLSSSQFRALLAFASNLHDTKRFRDADGALRLPDFSHAPALSTVLTRLSASPSRDMRAYAAGSLDRLGGTITRSQADRLILDTSYRVRSAAGRLLWHGSDTSVAQQHALVAWFDSPAALAEMRLDALREDFGVSSEDASLWSDTPDGLDAEHEEARGAFLGDALDTAPPDADISGLLDEVAKTSDVSDLIESAIAAIQRSTRLTGGDREAALLGLYHAAWSAAGGDTENPAPHATFWQAMTPVLAGAPTTDAALLADLDQSFSYGRSKQGDWATLRAALGDASVDARIAALTTLAETPLDESNAGLAAGLMAIAEVSDATRLDLLAKMAGGFEGARVAKAALGAGVDPRAVVANLSAALVGARGWTDADHADALAEAIGAPSMSGPEIAQAVTAWFANVDAYQLTQVTRAAAKLLRLLDDPRLSTSDRADAWTAVALENGAPRGVVLEMAPLTGPSRSILAALLRGKVVEGASTCWQGHTDPSTTQPALVFAWLPFLVRPTTTEVDARTLAPARVARARAASSAGAELPDGADASAVLAARPRLADLYLGADPIAVAANAPAASDADEALGISGDDGKLFDAVRRLMMAPDFRALDRAKLDEVEAHITQVAATPGARDQHLFALEVSYGVGYDALSRRFHGQADMRWDVGDAARSGGEAAALEAMLGAVGPSFQTIDSNIDMVTQIAARAAVTSSFRQGLLEFDLEAERFWTQDGSWTSGSLPVVRSAAADLSSLAGADAVHVFPIGATSNNTAFMARSSLFGRLLGDARVPASVATTLAWNRLATGQPLFEDQVEVTEAIDAVISVRGRDDVDEAEKRALGQALLRYLE